MLPPLWEHQHRALAFLKKMDPAVYLGMEMGTGKSRVMVEHCEREGFKRILVLSPKKVVNVWPREFAAYYTQDIDVLPLRKGTVEQRQQLAAQFMRANWTTPRVIVMNHDSCWREPFSDWVLNQHWDAIVIDEAHRAKDHSGKFGKFTLWLHDCADHRYCLSGTPMPHSVNDCTTGKRIPDPLDLFAQYRFLRPTLYGTRFHPFKTRLCLLQPQQLRSGQKFEKIIGFEPTALADFYKRKDLIMFELQKGEAPELPPQLDIVRTTSMEGGLARAYIRMARDFFFELDKGEVTAKNILSKVMRLRQICAGFLVPDGEDRTNAQVIHQDKLDLLEELLEDLTKPVVVVAQFQWDLVMIRALAEKLGLRYGEVSGRHEDLTNEATMRADTEVLGVQSQAGGVGIDLTRSNNTIFYSLDWNWGQHYQMRKRTHRHPQTKPCTYYYLLVENSIDQILYDALMGREDMDGERLMEIMQEQRARQEGRQRELEDVA